jgi:hypothetical protein
MNRFSLRLGCAIACSFVFGAFAHGGGLDKCGGHNNKKSGGYHVHNMAKYCGCHSDATECKPKSQAPAESSGKQSSANFQTPQKNNSSASKDAAK